ncbi:MAG: di-heme oxidoredictase family protein, partial [Paracoccaceae bacterium]
MWRAPAIFLMLGLPALAQGLYDRHLPVGERSVEDHARAAAFLDALPDFTTAEPLEAAAAGAATVPFVNMPDAFSHASANLGAEGQLAFDQGRALFRKTWIAAPASTRGADGLGPLYNARTCQDCHMQDGRGTLPAPGRAGGALFLRLSVPGGPTPDAIADYLATQPDPTYGSQLQDRASPGQRAEGRLNVTYAELPVTLSDGTIISLQKPNYAITDTAYGPLPDALMMSPRMAPQMIGLGLLEAIPTADILARADPDDADGNGISGRANVVISTETSQPMLGRFGHKAGMPTLREQTASAFAADMGLSTSLHPAPWGDCTPAQPDCRNAPHGQEPGIRDGLEVDDAALDLITFYSRNL